ncbi:MAG: glycosyl hydrolase [Bacteroidetes bacterium]|nr:glycosyl hydrolase [Bacteroidota bacterium]
MSARRLISSLLSLLRISPMKHLSPLFMLMLTMLLLIIPQYNPVHAQEDAVDGDSGRKELNSSIVSGLKFRSLGPGKFSGRIGDLAVNPENIREYYVAVASGGVWKTTNDGITFTPVFDNEGVYSIGCITLDPNNPHVVWVGTGENNSQRSVAWGDGVYRSADGGKTWKNMGLTRSEHIGRILIDPGDSRIVYVAAQGPLWGPGGDRGLYKSTDAGATWNAVLTVSEHTGITDVVMDPRDPLVLYAASYQRRRHVWTLINGGPESRLYKTTDGGQSWETLENGVPGGDVGRIGLALSPADPDYIYAIIEAAGDRGGVFRSTDRGASWEKRNSYMASSPQYYNELFCDPLDRETVYSMDVYTRVTNDGFRTHRRLGRHRRHVDDHALWIDPADTRHLRIGGDGGLYESYDGGERWRFKENLPVTQLYRVEVDNSEPFYTIYGGTQDNFSFGGPSRTIRDDGVFNDDWFITNGGDGFKTQIDPTNPDVVYAQSQYGVLFRFDKASGERLGIQPQPAPGEEAYRWNWDAPLLISPHMHTRLYFAANKLFRSDDRGESWTVISPDLTRRIDRNTLPVMGRIWPPEAVSKNASTSLYGNIVALDESPLVEGLLYVGTDDGLIQVSEDGGENWKRIAHITGVPETTYVSSVRASLHDGNTVYVTFNNHKMADFAPYVFRSTDRGRSWTSIASDLPAESPVHTLVEDHVKPSLLFAGHEFGVHVSLDGGGKWLKLGGGLPAIAVRDIAIQRREDDLVLATFGRGFYVLDDYSPLRHIDESVLQDEALLFPVRDALIYIEARDESIGYQGSTFFAAPNPPFGATFTWYLRDGHTSLKQKRKREEKQLRKENRTPPYPDWETLRAEDEEEAPILLLTIRDAEGHVIRQLTETLRSGLHRSTWDLRHSGSSPVGKGSNVNNHRGMPVMPGTYTVTLTKLHDGVETPLAGPLSFTASLLGHTTLPASNPALLAAFHARLMEVQRAGIGAQRYLAELRERLLAIEKTMLVTPGLDTALRQRWNDLRNQLRDIDRALNGDKAISSRNGAQPPSVMQRLSGVAWRQWNSTSGPITQHRTEVGHVVTQLRPLLDMLRMIGEQELPAIETALDRSGAPWTPGRIPTLD